MEFHAGNQETEVFNTFGWLDGGEICAKLESALENILVNHCASFDR